MSCGLDEFAIGVIEGFFGAPWSFEARLDYAAFLRARGYAFYIYAPKDDPILRKDWRGEWSAPQWAALRALRARYREAGLAFGLGLSPWDLHKGYDARAKAALEAKVRRLNPLEPDILAILFDDTPGISGDLARVQARIASDALAASNASVGMACPTYYSFDPIYEKALGPIPARYLEDFGAGLDGAVHVFWTGPEVCSRAYPEDHLAEVARRIGRKPFLWDNYPVNDGPAMARHLHLRAFENRGPALKRACAGLAANPMNQPHLSMIPLITLPMNLAQGAAYDPDAAFAEAARALGGAAFAAALAQDLALFHDAGLEAIDARRRRELAAKYDRLGGALGAEIRRWLAGGYEPTDEVKAEFEGWASDRSRAML